MDKPQLKELYDFMHLLDRGAYVEMRAEGVDEIFKPNCDLLLDALTEIVSDANLATTRKEMMLSYRKYGAEEAARNKELTKKIEELRGYNDKLARRLEWQSSLEDYGKE